MKRDSKVNEFQTFDIGDWGLGIGDWGLGPSPIPNPHHKNNC